jgi:hypothetical protein
MRRKISTISVATLLVCLSFFVINKASAKDITITASTSDRLFVTGNLCLNNDCKANWSAITGTGGWTLNGTNLYNNNTGNVGIGTTNPETPLEIYRTTPGDALLISSPVSSGNKNAIAWTDSKTSGVISARIANIDDGNYGANLAFETRTGIGTVTTERMRIMSTGNVGIADTNPTSAKLSVVGDVASSLSLRSAASASSNWLAGNVGIGNASIGASKLSVFGNASIGTGYFSSAAPTDGLIVAGNVGIGITNPRGKFDVGGFYTTNYITSNASWVGSPTVPQFIPLGTFNANSDVHVIVNLSGCAFGDSALEYMINKGYNGVPRVYYMGPSSYGSAPRGLDNSVSFQYETINTNSYYLGVNVTGGCSDSSRTVGLTTNVFGGANFSAVDANSANYTSISPYPYLYNGYEGNVGIGTTMPGAKLDVSGEVVSNTPGSSSGNIRMIGGNYGSFFRNDGGSTWFMLTASGNQYGGFNTLRPFYVNDATGDVTLGQNTLFPGSGIWNTSGNVGVGITNPSTHIQIYSNDVPEIASANPLGAFSIKSSASTAMVMGVDPNSPYEGWIQVRHGTVAGANYYPLSFQPLGGNVGIGTTAPNSKLQVAGSVNATGLCLSGDCKVAWADIVTAGGGNQWTTSGANIYNSNTGNVGVGDTNPAVAKLSVANNFNQSFNGVLSSAVAGKNILTGNGIVSNLYGGYFESDLNTTGLGGSPSSGTNNYGIYAKTSSTNYGHNNGGSTNYYGGYFEALGSLDGADPTTNYGIYVNAAGADTNYAGIFMGGNVGIADSNPTSAKLSVVGDVASSLSLRSSASASSNWLAGNVGIGNASIGASKLSVFGNQSIGTTFQSYPAPTNGLIVAGNVGIGTSNPLYKLTVGGEISATSWINSSSYVSAPIVYAGDSGADGNALLGSDGMFSGDEVGLYESSNSNALAVMDYTANKIYYGGYNGTSGLSNFWWDLNNNSFVVPNGNVGIGSTAPGSKLDILGPAGAGSTNLMRFILDGGYGVTAFNQFYASASNYGLDIDSGQFAINRGSGNVGIGITNPNAKLQVVGSINATGLCLSGDCRASWGSGQAIKSLTIPMNYGVERNYLIATLPVSGSGTGDAVLIEVIGITSSTGGKGILTVSLGQRGGFWYIKNVDGGTPGVYVRSYLQANSTTNVYITVPASTFYTAQVNYYQYGWGATLYEPTSYVTPVGTLNFDSSNNATYPVNDSFTYSNGNFLGNVAGAGALNITNSTVNSWISGNVGIGNASQGASKFSVFGNASIGSTYFSSAAPADGLIVAGNVGIGITNPGTKLSVAGQIIANEGNPYSGAGYSFIGEGGYDTGMFSTGDGVLDLWSNNVNTMNIRSGSVGIGTTAPGAKLDVSGGSIRTSNQLISTVAAGTAPLAVTSNTVVTNLNADLLDGIDTSKIIYGSNVAGINIAPATQNVYDVSQYKAGFWDVNGASWTPTTGWYWGATFAHESNGSSYNYSGQLIFQNSNGGNGVYARTIAGGTPSGWSRMLSNTSDVNSSGNLIITGAGPHYISSGNVGIGTTAPTVKLDVNGSFRVDSLGAGVVTSDSSGNFSVKTDYQSKIALYPFSFDTSAHYYWNKVAHLDGPYSHLNILVTSQENTDGNGGQTTNEINVTLNGALTIARITNIPLSPNRGQKISCAVDTNRDVWVYSNVSWAPQFYFYVKDNAATTVYNPVTIKQEAAPSATTVIDNEDKTITISTGAVTSYNILGLSNLDNSHYGIGTTNPSEMLEVVGNVKSTGFIYNSSDRSLKKDIQLIDNPLGKIMQLNGVTFNWKKDNSPSIGLIAQDVEKVFPEIVTGEEGNKSVAYSNLVAPLIEAVKAQQREIDALKLRVIILERQNDKSK